MEKQPQQQPEPQQLNIVQLIEDNPITKLSNTYQNRLLIKIKERFIEEQQQLFIANFYCYLNYNSTTDFVIDFDNVWKWIGYYNKNKAKQTLERHFIVGIDYLLTCRLATQNNNSQKETPTKQKKDNRGGHNKEIIMLTVKTFKSFCLKAGTKKAMELHEYYIQLEEIIHETICEECNDLKTQLQNQFNEKELLREKTIIEQFPKNTQCVYYGKIENKSTKKETLVKFGNSNFLEERVECHKKTYDDFCLLNAFKVNNKQQIENAIKKDKNLQEFRRSIMINQSRYTELLAINQHLTVENLDEIIKNIISNIECTPDNYAKIMEEKTELFKENAEILKENEKLKKQLADMMLFLQHKPIPFIKKLPTKN